MKTKILVVFGTRPEAIKMAPVVLALKTDDNFETRVCVTGQHREMLDQVLQLFNITPDYDLNIMKKNQDLSDITSHVIIGLRKTLNEFKPDRVLVHGDTTTTMAASLAGYYAQVPVCHIEAGLRTGNIYSPWPEEMNRKLTSSISDIHFAPTQWAKQNLINEGIQEEQVEVTGNTVIDALLWVTEKIKADSNLEKSLEETFSFLPQKNDVKERIILVTGHRRENFGKPLEDMCQSLLKLAANKNVRIVYPVHLNPNVQKPVYAILGNQSRIHLIEPQCYVPFVYLMNKAYFVITDSGGIQEEAPSLGKPVLVTRETTERPEAVKAGTVKLVGSSPHKILKESEQLLNNTDYYKQISCMHNPYGDGKASERILRRLRDAM